MTKRINAIVKMTYVCAMLLAGLSVASCGSPVRNAVPAAESATATVPGMPQVRFWGDMVTPEMAAWLQESLQRERASLNVEGITTWPDTSYLAISGGGADGAFGAGLLCGWTAHSDRPAFRIITGVSTGALIAPFVFAGPEYDYVLREVYTSISTKDIGRSRGIIDGLLGDALLDSQPLREIVDRCVDEAFLAKVAEEYQKGRGLILCTTNMDSQRPVLWAMGTIAASGHPDSLELFRDIMMASAAIPGVFPPVMIDVETNGKLYQEMHADGGVTSQVFLYPASFSIRKFAEAAGVNRERTIYVIRNAKTSPRYEPVKLRTLSIAQRAIATLIKNQGVGDLYRIYLGCERDGLHYRLAHIPDDFALEPKEAFDPTYMKALFDVAYEQASKGYPWKHAPPGFDPPEQQATSK
jgi:predicted acylesterase/phospholipase RssA